MYYPLNYHQINVANGTYFPSSVKNRNNKSYAFWERALFQKACSVIKINGLPEEWEGNVKDFIYYTLFRFGYGVVAADDEFGTFFQPCGLSGYDFYYQPNKAIVSNPMLKNGHTEYYIGESCEIVKLTPDYRGIWDIIDYYAEKLSLLDNSINMGLVNSKFAYIFGAKNKSGANALKKMLDLVNKGEPAVVFDSRIADDTQSKGEPWQYLDLKVKNNYLTDVQLKDFQTLLNNFSTEIGIPTIPYEKKERMVESEAESKQFESIARCTVWVDTLNSSFEKVNDMFGLNLQAELRFKDMEGVNDGKDNDSSIQ